MEQILKKIIRQEGISVLSQPEKLREALAAHGAKPEAVLQWTLLLTACPNASALATRQEVTAAELNAVVSAAVQASALHPARVRKMLGQLLRAAEVKLPSGLLSLEKRSHFQGTVEVEQEEELLKSANGETEEKPETALTVLQTLSDNGNGHASYCLGLYFRKHTVEGVDCPAMTHGYFEKAAEQGYGPAFGALADDALHGKKKRLEQAAKYFAQPNALVGQHGKEWSKNAAALLAYRENNRSQGKTALGISLLALLCTLAASVIAVEPWLVPAAVAEAVCVFTCTFNLLLRPYASYRKIYGVLAACWLLGGMLSVIW